MVDKVIEAVDIFHYYKNPVHVTICLIYNANWITL